MNDIKRGDWIANRIDPDFGVFKIDHIDSVGDYWDRNPDARGSKVILESSAVKLYPLTDTEFASLKEGDQVVNIDEEGDHPGDILTVTKKYNGQYVTTSGPDYTYIMLVPKFYALLSSGSRKPIEGPKEQQALVPCPHSEWLGLYSAPETHEQGKLEWDNKQGRYTFTTQYSETFKNIQSNRVAFDPDWKGLSTRWVKTSEWKPGSSKILSRPKAKTNISQGCSGWSSYED